MSTNPLKSRLLRDNQFVASCVGLLVSRVKDEMQTPKPYNLDGSSPYGIDAVDYGVLVSIATRLNTGASLSQENMAISRKTLIKNISKLVEVLNG